MPQCSADKLHIRCKRSVKSADVTHCVTVAVRLPLSSLSVPITSHIEKKATALKAFRSDMFQPVIGSNVVVNFKEVLPRLYYFDIYYFDIWRNVSA